MKLTDNFGPAPASNAPGVKPKKTIAECTPFEAGFGIAWAFVVVGLIIGLLCALVVSIVRNSG